MNEGVLRKRLRVRAGGSPSKLNTIQSDEICSFRLASSAWQSRKGIGFGVKLPGLVYHSTTLLAI